MWTGLERGQKKKKNRTLLLMIVIEKLRVRKKRLKGHNVGERRAEKLKLRRPALAMTIVQSPMALVLEGVEPKGRHGRR